MRQHCTIKNALFSSTVDRGLQFLDHRILTSANYTIQVQLSQQQAPAMSATPVAQTMEDSPQLQQLKQQGLDFLDAIIREVESLGDDVYLLNPAQLAALHVRKAEPIDIDGQTIDFGPRFFSPRCSLEQARQKTAAFLADHGALLNGAEWQKRCRRGSCTDFLGPEDIHDPEERHPLCTPEQCAEFRLHWFYCAMGAYGTIPWIASRNFGVVEGSDWYHVR